MEITLKEVTRMEDPTGILQGVRDEVHAVVQFEEEDELYRPSGIGVRFIMDVERRTILTYYVYETADGSILHIELEEDELEQLRTAYETKYVPNV